MKKALSVVLSVIIMLSFTGCLGAEKGEIGKTHTSQMIFSLL